MTMTRLKVAEGRFVRDPVTKLPLGPDGEDRELDTFWRRRIAAGDVEIEGGTPSGAATGEAGAEGDTGEKTAARRGRGSQE